MNQRTASERADYLSRRRARLLLLLGALYITFQALFLETSKASEPSDALALKIGAWLVLSLILLSGLATKGFWLQPKNIRDLIDDENTRANRFDAMRFGFVFGMLTCVVIYFITMFEPVNGRDAVHIVMSDGIGAALLRWGWLERVAHRSA
jgi:hypothetical protein